MGSRTDYLNTDKGASVRAGIRDTFLEQVADLDVRYQRGGVSRLSAYAKSDGDKRPQRPLYSPEEARRLIELGVEQRMKVKISDHYNALVQGSGSMPPSEALANLVTARGEEVADLSGEIDPSNQLGYSPLPGVLHKYEMALLYVAKTCSAHCRYCYRSDLFSGISGKQLAKIDPVVEYIENHNDQVVKNGGKHPKSGHPALKEVLLSGGDPMILSNKKLAQWLSALADAGIQKIRIGTKELAFFPQRFDDAFFAMLDAFHEYYSDTRIVFATHFTHPDEFLFRDEEGDPCDLGNGRLEWLSPVYNAVAHLGERRHFVSLENQTPIIRDVNDDAKALRVLQRELYAHGIGNHYFFQCRQIQGFRAFAIPVEETLSIFNESKRGLSGVESHARLVMSAEEGKMEICGVAGDQIVFRRLRVPGAAEEQGRLYIAPRNPDAYWITDYDLKST
ncbi:hypothetical protein [Pelagicoccus sp. SDUM812003]|uniref:hypothetical protein n=1 Tax=Pelagicoccus sp. SDUM812003 TaxID=3041267 RepID=UPI00280FC536|nr:hypothetical protein [Pelagicoccus sp. SDUM812003]MDQ8202901.1 hypothetical protein [Pelagicoccus sp. SDUM812003]